jgi:hypothetical protein
MQYLIARIRQFLPGGATRRPDHRPGHILDVAVIHTVTLPQQRLSGPVSRHYTPRFILSGNPSVFVSL